MSEHELSENELSDHGLTDHGLTDQVPAEPLPGGQPTGAAVSDRDDRGPRWAALRRPHVYLPLALVLLVFLVAAFPQWFAGWFGHGDPRECSLIDSNATGRPGHPFGFDVQGCDLYANVVYGTRASVLIAVLVVASSTVVAVVLGALAGYFRGPTDSVISRVMDVFFGFPALVGMIILLNTIPTRSVWTVAGVLALFAWPAMTRVFRASVLETANLDYVVAAREMGAGHLRIIASHVVPNSIGPLASILSLSIGGIITAEAGLTFLGVGLRSPAISWGVQLNTAQRYFTTDFHLLLFPSLFLSVTVLAFVLLGDGLRDVLDPKAK
ncbi:ABC transporter permease [Nakamurella lactea]|uniref:ABC transporter permease n=1 Tax=Nakamurella lactea TaxID=459515 RepID=UPI00042476E6|nr:ABC transporter permease [Nakamurella lactea]